MNRAIVLGIFLVISCAHEFEASYCAVVDAHDSRIDDLLNRFDVFANSLNLEIDHSHPSSHRYINSNGSYEIKVTTHLGELGSIVALFLFDDEDTRQIQLQLRSLIIREVQPNFGFTLCHEIEGFQNPTRYR